MYISACAKKDKSSVLVWERTPTGRIEKEYESPLYFYSKNKNGKFKDIYGNALKQHTHTNWFELKKEIELLKNKGESLYESDIQLEYKVLAKHYYGKPITNLNITFFDIEVDYDKNIGFSDIDNPYAPINAIALHHYWKNKDIVLLVPPETRKNITEAEFSEIYSDYPNVEIIICKDEKQLLKLFFDNIEDSDIISGWNSAIFDVPYIYERTKRCLGEIFANKLSFPNAKEPHYKDFIDKTGINRLKMEIYGRESVDYLEIFKKFEVVDRQSYSLESISEEKFPHLKKLEYDGSLYDLYRYNFEQFIRYNIRDCEILKALEDDLGYMQVAIEFAMSACALLKDVTGTLKLAECDIINYCHNVLNVVVPDSQYNITENNEKFTGALVLPPIVGMHEWVAAVDVASLYPSAIMTVNISPDTIIGQFFDNNDAYKKILLETDDLLYFKYENSDMVEKTAKEWKKWLKQNNYSISGYGSVFTLTRHGFIPEILMDWFKKRKNYKKLASSANTKYKELKEHDSDYLKYKHEYEYNNRLQYVFKIRLNSLYGALGNKFFKFFDIRLAESTTRSGQEVLMHMVRKSGELMDGEYMYPSPAWVYSDTDSCYFKTYANDIDEAILVGKAVQDNINKSFKTFTHEYFLCIDGFDQFISTELDLIASNSIFIKKKNYIMQLAYADGKKTNKIKMMGVSIKKTTIPKPVSKKLTVFLENLLKGKNWNELGQEIVDYKDYLINSAPIQDIGLPKGIKGLNEKEQEYLNGNKSVLLSGHAAASIFYNMCLDQYNDKESLRIKSGMKIRTYYLNKKFGRFKSIALPTDLTHIPKWFIDHFQPLIDKSIQADRLIDKPLKSILSAINKSVPTRKNLLFEELVIY